MTTLRLYMEAWSRKKEILNAFLINISPCPLEQHWVFQRMFPSFLGDAVAICGLPSVFLQCLLSPLFQSLDHMLGAAEKLLFLCH